MIPQMEFARLLLSDYGVPHLTHVSIYNKPWQMKEKSKFKVAGPFPNQLYSDIYVLPNAKKKGKCRLWMINLSSLRNPNTFLPPGHGDRWGH